MKSIYTTTQMSLIVAFAFLGTLFDGADFFIFTFFMGPMAKYFSVSQVEITFIHTTSYFAGIIGGILFGMYSDRFGRRRGLAATVAVYSIFTGLAGFAPNVTTYLILRFFAGIGIGGEMGIAFAYLTEVFPMPKNRRGLYCGAMQTMFMFGALVAAGLYQITSIHFGAEAWRYASFALGGVAVLGAFIRLWMPESKLWEESRKKQAHQKEKSMPIMEIFRGSLRKTTLWATVVWTCGFYGCYSVVVFLPTLLNTVYKLPSNTVAKVSYIGNGIVIVAYLLGGWLMDVIGRRKTFYLTGILGTLAFFSFFVTGNLLNIIPTAENIFTSPVFFSIIFMQMGYAYFGGQGAWLSEMYPTHVRTTGVNTVYYVARALGAGGAPLLALSFVTAIGYDVRLAIAMGCIGTGLLVVFSRMLPDTKDIELKAN